MAKLEQEWRQFLEGPLYPDADVPWRDDPAYSLLLQFPGVRDCVGGQVAPALTQAIGLVQALAQVDLRELVRKRRPAHGLSLGFGMNMHEPYDLFQVFELDVVHGYEWIGEQVVDAARSLQALQDAQPDLPARIRLHHSTISDLHALADASVRVVYAANVFHPEIPMASDTFERTVQEILRVLEPEGILVSRGSSGVLEASLAPHGRMLVQTPLVTVFQKQA
ncbi:MAG TPA: methyltransferase domain-containing protein [Methylomirabilota bacterium]|nr:methyltransferase domain-containing protein [Methylomirabilota bacterium]